MEKRLQLLLDRARYARVEAEAHKSGRSVAAVIREAIDVRFPNDETEVQAAVVRFLAATAEPSGVEPDWADSKAAMEDELEAKLTR